MHKKTASVLLIGLTAVSLSIFLLIQIVLGAPAAQQGLETVFLPIINKPILPPEQWIATFGTADTEIGNLALETSDGSILLAAGQQVIKLTSEGEVVWQKIISEPNGNTYISINSVVESDDGAYVAAGSKSYDVWVTKISNDGFLVWQKQYGGEAQDYAMDIQETVDQGFILTGQSGSGGSMWVIKLEENGEVSWQKTYSLLMEARGNAIEPTNDGGYIVVGYGGQILIGTGDFVSLLWLLRLDAEGSVIWQKSFGYLGESGADVHQTSDGGFIVAGSTRSFGAGELDTWVLKLDGAGSVIWQKTYGGTGNDIATDVQEVEGKYLVSGSTRSFGAGGWDGWLLMLNVDGTIAWQKTYGGSDYDILYSIDLMSDGSYLLTGGTASYGEGESDAWVMKLDVNGDVAGCDLIGSSNVVGMDTAVIGVDTDTIPQISSATPITSTAVSQTSNVIKTQQCVAP